VVIYNPLYSVHWRMCMSCVVFALSSTVRLILLPDDVFVLRRINYSIPHLVTFSPPTYLLINAQNRSLYAS